MQKFKRLLSPQKKQPDSDLDSLGGLEAISPTVTSLTQPIPPTSPSPPVDNPPSYEELYEPPSYNEDQVIRLRDELQQVRRQPPEAQSPLSNPLSQSRLVTPAAQSRPLHPEADRQQRRGEALLAAGEHPSLSFENAVRAGNQSTIQMLLDHGADASKGLKSAVVKGDSLLVGLLLDHGAAVDAKSKDIAELLLARGANIVAQDYQGKTPLDFAVMAVLPAIVGLLLEHGAATSSAKKGNMLNEFVKATIKWAPSGAMDNVAEIIQLFIKHGFRLDFNAGSDSKILGLAAEKGRQDLVQVLLDNGADVDGRDNKGRTALHLATMNGHSEIVTKLLEKGADPSVANKCGRTAEY